jgi:TolA-binding protein
MSHNKKHSDQHENLLKQQALEQQEVKEVLVFLKKYSKPVMTAILAVCIVVLAKQFIVNQKIKKRSQADSALMHANSAEALQNVLNDYPSTPASAVAMMGLARDKFNAGKTDEAEALYNQFIKKYAQHELASLAELNLITCKEAREQFGDAHLLYTEFAKNHAKSYLAPAAIIGQARCLEALGQLAEARSAYEDIMVNFPESSWSQIASANQKVILGKLE